MFDSFHWFCGTNADPDDLLYAAQHADRLVALHLNDGVSGLPYDEQRDLRRALPMTTGVIDAKKVLSAFTRADGTAPYMIEPFEPARAELAALDADAAVRTIAAALRRFPHKGRSVSKRMVTGPSFRESTCISAPNSPC